MARARKGISPVIATVIIVAVAIAISIAVAGWLMGLWGTFGSTESLKVMPNSTLVYNSTTSTATLTLSVKNVGSKPAQITEVELVGVNKWTSGTNLPTTVDPGKTATITITGITGVNPGAQYTIKVYTASGNVYTGYVVAQSG